MDETLLLNVNRRFPFKGMLSEYLLILSFSVELVNPTLYIIDRFHGLSVHPKGKIKKDKSAQIYKMKRRRGNMFLAWDSHCPK